MKNNNFYTIQGWMVNDLKLKGNELICYAVIYCFSQDEETLYMGGVKYLEGWMNATEPTVLLSLDKLIKKGFIRKHEVITESGKRCYYAVTKESLVGGTKESLVGGTKESLVKIYNNKERNKESLSNDKQKKSRFVKPTIEQIAKYIEEKKMHFDAERFFDYYESTGWMVGRNHMKDWKAACRTWESKRKDMPVKESEEQNESDVAWKPIKEWLDSTVPLISNGISPNDFAIMKSMTESSQQLAKILVDINNSCPDGDIMHEFKRILHEQA